MRKISEHAVTVNERDALLSVQQMDAVTANEVLIRLVKRLAPVWREAKAAFETKSPGALMPLIGSALDAAELEWTARQVLRNATLTFRDEDTIESSLDKRLAVVFQGDLFAMYECTALALGDNFSNFFDRLGKLTARIPKTQPQPSSTPL